jgi:RNA polymerase sigma-70 factor (ECF subfamily)
MRPLDRPFPSSSCVAPIRAVPDLVDRLIARDGSAYEELVREHGPRMLAVASRYLPCRADAEDAVQDAFADVFRTIAGLRRASGIETWLHRIVVNRALIALRRRRRKPETPLDEGMPAQGVCARGRFWPAATAHQVAAGDDLNGLVRGAVNRLPAPQRSVIVLLRDIGALPLADLARLLDVRASTVKGSPRQARHALQRALRAELRDADA